MITMNPNTFGDKPKQNIFNSQVKENINLLLNDGTFEKKVNFTPTPDGINQSFTLEYEIEENSEKIFIGGAFIFDSGDYTILGTTLTFNFVPYSTDNITIFGKRKV